MSCLLGNPSASGKVSGRIRASEVSEMNAMRHDWASQAMDVTLPLKTSGADTVADSGTGAGAGDEAATCIHFCIH